MRLNVLNENTIGIHQVFENVDKFKPFNIEKSDYINLITFIRSLEYFEQKEHSSSFDEKIFLW